MHFTDLESLNSYLIEEWSKLDCMEKYLNENGYARLEAIKCVLWQAGNLQSIEELAKSVEYIALISIPNKYPAYYDTLREIDCNIESILRGD